MKNPNGPSIEDKESWADELADTDTKTGIQLITIERARQILQEGWSDAHDDTHDCGEMAYAAAAYAEQAASRGWLIYNPKMIGIKPEEGPDRYQADEAPDNWPEDWEDYWKPKDPIRDLVRAGALIAAEIDRLQRIPNKPQPSP